MRISTRIWLIIFGMMISFGVVITLLLVTLDGSNQSLQIIQTRSQQWTTLELNWNQQKTLYVKAQDEARDLALTANGDIDRLETAITDWQMNVMEIGEFLSVFSSDNEAVNAAMSELATAYDEGTSSHAELIEAWNAKSSFQTRKLERSLESATESMDESLSAARDVFSQYLAELQSQTSTSISARFSQVIIIIPLVLLGVFGYAFLMLRHIRKNLFDTMKQLDDASQGDLNTHYVPKASRDELTQMNNSVAHMQGQLTSIVEQVLNKAEALQGSAGVLSEHVNETLSGYNTEQQALDELQAVYEHLTQGATRVKDLGEQVASQSESASQASQQGAGLTQQTTEALKVLDESVASSMRAVEDLSQSSSAISDILNVIRGIAEQTNLLALNAAIEAARAGEQGRGFAVVADEVRNLAKRTQDSTMEIENLVQHLHSTIEGVSERTEASQTEAQNVQSLATQVETQFKEIEAAVDNIRQTSIGNTELSQEQATSMYQANANLESMTHQSRHRKTQVEELAHNASTLNQISEELRKVMMFFKLDEQK